MEWRHSGLPRIAPKNSGWKIRWKISCLGFFVIKTASSSLIIFQRAKLSARSITHLCWCNWRACWRKNVAGSSLRKSCSCTKTLQLTATCNREETGLPGFPISWYPPYSPDLAPSDYYLFLGLKKQLKRRHFSSDSEVIAAAESWLDGQPSDFFWVACKS